MSTFTDTRIVCLTSQSATVKRNGSYLSDLMYGFGFIYKNDPDIIHRQVQLLSAQIPYSFYVINYTNNIFRCDLGFGVQTYTIPVGNYTASSLTLAIMTIVDQPGFVINISNITGKLTFSYTEVFYIYNNFNNSIASILGFEANSITFSDAFNFTCPYPCNLLGIKTLQIRSSNLVMRNVSSIEGGQTILLASVPVSAVPFGMIEYTDKGNLISIDNQELDDILIELIDGESGSYINMNGQDWCITLAFHLTKVYTPKPDISIPKISFGPKDLSKKKTQDTVNPVLTEDEQTLKLLEQ